MPFPIERINRQNYTVLAQFFEQAEKPQNARPKTQPYHNDRGNNSETSLLKPGKTNELPKKNHASGFASKALLSSFLISCGISALGSETTLLDRITPNEDTKHVFQEAINLITANLGGLSIINYFSNSSKQRQHRLKNDINKISI